MLINAARRIFDLLKRHFSSSIRKPTSVLHSKSNHSSERRLTRFYLELARGLRGAHA